METTDRQRLRDEFVEVRGYWSPLLESLLEVDPGFFEQYLALATVPWRHGGLEPKVKEFIYTAFDVAATHLYEPGLRQHIRNALGYGATREEIMEVIELASLIGVHSCAVGVPILLEELAS
jgi:alkylhydroperoxidase/carboxymuconolactone decarboxylase family protein YurZ